MGLWAGFWVALLSALLLTFPLVPNGGITRLANRAVSLETEWLN
jgi:hypothetical protein